MRVLELYSGVGGMHYALIETKLNFSIVAAIDINDTATSVYRRNFPFSNSINREIESLTVHETRTFGADLWCMSPPCQPFTRLGKHKCETDDRCSSFMHMLISVLPKFILLENVKGFDGTKPWAELLQALIDCNYVYQQFILSPLQFGIPNCRSRYYLVARLRPTLTLAGSSALWSQHKPTKSPAPSEEEIHHVPPRTAPALPGCKCPVCCGQVRHIYHSGDNNVDYLPYCPPISNFLVDETSEEHSKRVQYLNDSQLSRYFGILDIVRPSDHKTRCFTKGYAKRIEGTGSVLQTASLDMSGDDVSASWTAANGDQKSLLTLAHKLRLRFFLSREVANFLCFPPSFGFPDEVTEKQRLRLLGNSINVLVVSHLLHWAFGDVTDSTLDQTTSNLTTV
ncbi:unnamed protein product [Dicrocoelium dendriticum]|nr:unnamed protein product [Dicrocoelium dendriticum]